jgi:hypothetical protein
MRLNFFRDIVIFLFAGKEAVAEVATGGPYTRGSTSNAQNSTRADKPTKKAANELS